MKPIIALVIIVGLTIMASAASVLRPLVVRPAAPLVGKILLVNGSNFLLRTNGTNKVCRAGGC